MNTLIKDNEGLIHKVINNLRYIPRNVERDDLFQIGSIGLWKALCNFNADMGCSVASFCYKTIQFEIMNYLRELQAEKRTFYSVEENHLICEAYNNIDDEVSFRLLIEEINKHISSTDTQMLVDRHVNRLSCKALGIRYSMSERTVIRRLNNALNTLREELIWGRDCFEQGVGFYESYKAS